MGREFLFGKIKKVLKVANFMFYVFYYTYTNLQDVIKALKDTSSS